MIHRYFRVILLLAILIILPACLRASAHPGRTDSNGGHYDRSTGEYHYHHGYPAHQHDNGVCPYDYDDKTGQRSGSSSSNTRSMPETAANTEPETTSEESRTKSEYVSNYLKEQKKQTTKAVITGIIELVVGVIVGWIFVLVLAGLGSEHR